MSRTAKTLIIANPASANGKVGRRWARIYSQIKGNYEGSFDVEMTQRPGHATELSREAIKAGYELVVALGGDGTANEVVNGFFSGSEPFDTDAVLGFLPLGTGNDLGKTLGIPKQFPQAVKALGTTGARHVDVGKVTKSRVGHPAQVRHFLNSADFGAGGAVAERVNRTSKVLGPQLSYLWGIISTLTTYKNPAITFSVDEDPEQRAIINDFIVANGKYFGGGLKPAPDARMDDGLFDIVTLGDIGFLESLWNLPRLKRGTHLDHPKTQFRRGRRVVAQADERVLIEADGEVVGSLPATFEIIPGALLVK